jgi:hypothetical protein
VGVMPELLSRRSREGEAEANTTRGAITNFFREL